MNNNNDEGEGSFEEGSFEEKKSFETGDDHGFELNGYDASSLSKEIKAIRDDINKLQLPNTEAKIQLYLQEGEVPTEYKQLKDYRAHLFVLGNIEIGIAQVGWGKSLAIEIFDPKRKFRSKLIEPKIGQEIVIGRSDLCDFEITDRSVSRWHMSLRIEYFTKNPFPNKNISIKEEVMFVKDCKSLNGTVYKGGSFHPNDARHIPIR